MKVYGIDVLFRIVVYTIRTVINGRVCSTDTDFGITDLTLQNYRSPISGQMEGNAVISIAVINNLGRAVLFRCKSEHIIHAVHYKTFSGVRRP